MKRYVVFLVYQEFVHAFRVDSWHFAKLFWAFKKKNYTSAGMRDLHLKHQQRTALVRVPCSWGQQGLGVPCALLNHAQPHFLSCHQIFF